MHKETRNRIILVLASVALSVFCLEALFRVYLSLNFSSLVRDNKTVRVHSASFWEYDREFGYSYPVNGATHMALIRDNEVVLCQPQRSDSLGNPGRTALVENPEHTVFVFGDSFTAYPMGEDGDATWPGLLQAALNESGKSVRVVNYSRDGIGILQMIDLASATVEEERPDLVILAFITRDLTRARIWRASRQTGLGDTEAVTSIDPELSYAPRTFGRNSFIDQRADHAWCERAMAQGRDEPMLKEMLDTYAAVARSEADRFGGNWPWSLSTSYLYLQLRHGDPFRELRFSSRTMGIDLLDYGGDPGFMAGIEVLQRSGADVLLVWLPMHPEAAGGAHVLTEQEQALADSLLELSGFPLFDLTPAEPLGADADPYYLRPADEHPTLAGYEWFAAELVDEVRERLQ
ncbi:MAG: hypothetical protein D6E12_07475 [Desulfovibrio sp.]|nr:MAG: hypothetical protein D6E12_07475 [Desulfovibrio sp.]